MALPQDKKDEILSEQSKYPRVTKLTEPLIVRPNKLSLLINDTMFFAKIKTGLAAKGFLIYSSGLGIPIYDNTFSSNEKVALNKAFSVTPGLEESAEKDAYIRAAKKWLDLLEIEIADQVNDNPVKAAIDRLNWQQHYDTTGSETDFVTEFAENDFAEVNIDWNGSSHGSGEDINTIPITIEKAVENITGIDYDDPTSRRGTLYTITQQIRTLDTNFNSNNGSIPTLNNTINQGFSNAVESMNELNDDLNKVSSQDSEGGTLYYIGRSLKDNNDSYTISKALREENQSSVSGSIDNARTTIQSEIQGQTSSLNGSLGSIDGRLSNTNQTLGTIDSRLHYDDGGIVNNVAWTSRIVATNTDNIKQSVTNIDNKTGSIQNDVGTLAGTVGTDGGNRCVWVYNNN